MYDDMDVIVPMSMVDDVVLSGARCVVLKVANKLSDDLDHRPP